MRDASCRATQILVIPASADVCDLTRYPRLPGAAIARPSARRRAAARVDAAPARRPHPRPRRPGRRAQRHQRVVPEAQLPRRAHRGPRHGGPRRRRRALRQHDSRRQRSAGDARHPGARLPELLPPRVQRQRGRPQGRRAGALRPRGLRRQHGRVPDPRRRALRDRRGLGSRGRPATARKRSPRASSARRCWPARRFADAVGEALPKARRTTTRAAITCRRPTLCCTATPHPTGRGPRGRRCAAAAACRPPTKPTNVASPVSLALALKSIAIESQYDFAADNRARLAAKLAAPREIPGIPTAATI